MNIIGSLIVNMKVSTRILLVVVFPILALIAMSTKSFVTLNNEKQEALYIKEVTHFMPYITNYLYEIQKETGYAEAYLATESSYNNPYTKKLDEQINDSHHNKNELIKFYEKSDKSIYSDHFNDAMDDLITNISQFDKVREEIKGKHISKDKAFKEYKEIGDELLSIVNYIVENAKSAEIIKQLITYQSTLMMAEAKSMERAVMVAAIQSNKVTMHDRELYSEFKGMYSSYHNIFEKFATDKEIKSFKKMVDASNVTKEIHKYKKMFLDINKEYEILSVNSLEIFDLFESEVKLINTLSIEVRENLEELAEKHLHHANSEMMYEVGFDIAMLVLAIIIVIAIAKSITTLLRTLTARMSDLTKGNYNVTFPKAGRNNELADIRNALEIFRTNGLEMDELKLKQEETKKAIEKQRKLDMLKMADGFDGQTADLIRGLLEAASEMQGSAQELEQASAETSQASTVVASAATQASANVQTVAAAGEELSSASNEISRQVNDVATKANQASRQATKSSESVSKLNQLAESIGEVVGAIKDIAEQTNLLALNATIEAARAGDAGKGFAVVADEVKKLATETSQKTEMIDNQVQAIQAAIHESSDAMNRIIKSIGDIDHSASSVAAAVEEQNAATAEIGRNVSEASQGTEQVSRSIIEVQSAAVETGQSAKVVLDTSKHLNNVSNDLKSQLGGFLETIRHDNKIV